MTSLLHDLQTNWPPIAPYFSLRNEEEYDVAVERLNALVDEVGTNERHPLYSVLDTLGTLVHSYEEQHHTIPDATGPEVLQYLMEEHGVVAAQLAEVASSAEIEGYLAGRQQLSVEQLRILGQRFRVSPSAFI